MIQLQSTSRPPRKKGQSFIGDKSQVLNVTYKNTYKIKEIVIFQTHSQWIGKKLWLTTKLKFGKFKT